MRMTNHVTAAASKKYKGKTIVIEGKVLQRSKEKVIDNFVILEGYDKTGKGTYRVYCGFPFTEEKDIVALKPGDKVKIQGEVEGGWGTGAKKDTITLNVCKMVK
jgi:uncharacterized protein YdeI (BOF family)